MLAVGDFRGEVSPKRCFRCNGDKQSLDYRVSISTFWGSSHPHTYLGKGYANKPHIYIYIFIFSIFQILGLILLTLLNHSL